jgi:hypothetical protein
MLRAFEGAGGVLSTERSRMGLCIDSFVGRIAISLSNDVIGAGAMAFGSSL